PIGPAARAVHDGRALWKHSGGALQERQRSQRLKVRRIAVEIHVVDRFGHDNARSQVGRFRTPGPPKNPPLYPPPQAAEGSKRIPPLLAGEGRAGATSQVTSRSAATSQTAITARAPARLTGRSAIALAATRCSARTSAGMRRSTSMSPNGTSTRS